MRGSAWCSYRTVGAEPATLSRSEAALQHLVRCCVRNRPPLHQTTRHLFFKRGRGSARRGSKGPSSFLRLEAPMMRLSYQSRKQQAQPEKGLPCCQRWLPRGGCENSHWWGEGRLSFSPNWLSAPSPFLGPCRGSPASTGLPQTMLRDPRAV